MIQTRLKKIEPCTWRDLYDALNHPTVAMSDVACKLVPYLPPGKYYNVLSHTYVLPGNVSLSCGSNWNWRYWWCSTSCVSYHISYCNWPPNWQQRLDVINPRRKCGEGCSSWFVCLCVCLCVWRRLFWHKQATRRPISGFRTTRAWKIKGWFSSNDCVRDICHEASEKKPKYIIALGLPRPDPLAPVYLGGSGIHNEWHVSTLACCIY